MSGHYEKYYEFGKDEPIMVWHDGEGGEERVYTGTRMHELLAMMADSDEQREQVRRLAQGWIDEELANRQFVEMFVVYENPSDFPGQYVCRKWRSYDDGTVDAEGQAVAVSPDYDFVREHIPDTCVRMERAHDDDPAIKEVWL